MYGMEQRMKDASYREARLRTHRRPRRPATCTAAGVTWERGRQPETPQYRNSSRWPCAWTGNQGSPAKATDKHGPGTEPGLFCRSGTSSRKRDSEEKPLSTRVGKSEKRHERRGSGRNEPDEVPRAAGPGTSRQA